MEVQDRQLWTMVESLDLVIGFIVIVVIVVFVILIIIMFVSPDLPNPILAQHQHPQVDQGLQAGYVVQPEIIHHFDFCRSKMFSTCYGRGRGRRAGWSFPSCGSA